MAAETTTTALSVLSLVIGFLRSVVGETHPRKVVPSIQTNVNPGFPLPLLFDARIAGDDAGVKAINLLRMILDQLGATPADASKDVPAGGNRRRPGQLSYQR
jgi:hypothetical protein